MHYYPQRFGFQTALPEPFTPQDIVTHTDQFLALVSAFQLRWRAGWRWPLGH